MNNTETIPQPAITVETLAAAPEGTLIVADPNFGPVVKAIKVGRMWLDTGSVHARKRFDAEAAEWVASMPWPVRIVAVDITTR